MKKIICSLVMCSALLFTSCDGFLDEKNHSSVVTDQYYRTAQGMESIVIASYSRLREIYSDPVIFLAGTDLHIVYHGRSADNPGLAQYYSLTPSDGDVTTFYKKCFNALGYINTALYYGDKTEATPVLKQQIAEMRFLRAFIYWHLVQQFGDVAIVTEMITSPVLEYPRDPAEQVWNFIITEMTEALPDLPARIDAKSSDFGHIDQRACNHFIAKSYLTRGWKSYAKSDDFAKAKQYADAAIGTMTELSLTFAQTFAPLPDYAWRNDEVILSVIYSQNSMSSATTGSSQGAYFSGYLDGTPSGNKQTNQKLSQTLYNMWLNTKDIEDPNNDSRWDVQYDLVTYKTSFAPYDKTPAELAETPIFGVYIPWWKPEAQRWVTRADLLADYPAWKDVARFRHYRAPSKDMTLASVEELKAINKTILFDDENPEDMKLSSAQTSNYFYANFKKFDCPTGQRTLSGTSSFRDIEIARISDTYLIAAEACIKMGQTGDAAEYINKIRRRAIAATDAKREITASQATIDFVLEERARELFGSYDRWYDLSRTNTLVERAVRYNPDLEGDESQFRGPDGQLKLLRPIPQSAIDANSSAITQNPGY